VYVSPTDTGSDPLNTDSDDDLLLAGKNLMGRTVTADLGRCNGVGPSDAGVSDCDVADICVLECLVEGEPVTVSTACEAYTEP
jgi:hypothetical protein